MGTFRSILTGAAAILSSNHLVSIGFAISTLIGVAFFLMASAGVAANFAVMFEMSGATSTRPGVYFLSMLFSVSLDRLLVFLWVRLLVSAFQLPNVLPIGLHVPAGRFAVIFRVSGSLSTFLGVQTGLASRLVAIANGYAQKPSRVKLTQRLPLVTLWIRTNLARNAIAMLNRHVCPS